MREEAESIVKTLREHGFTAYFAGGCVRDMLRGMAPKDFDIATDARPEQVQALFHGSHAVGAHFGVILLRRPGGDYEIATFREDHEYADGRRPGRVTFATAEEDAHRRDFTINGLFFDPIDERVIDFVGGRADLDAGIVRAIGDPEARFIEDHLRLLRGVRFAAALGFSVEAQTWESLRRHAVRIREIAPERVRDEVVRILTAPTRVRGFDLLVESGLMEAIVPEVIALQGCEQPPQFHPEGDVFVHTRRMLELLPDEASTTLVLSVLLHDIGKPATWQYDAEADRIRFNGHDKVGADIAGHILRRLKFSNEVIHAVVEAVEMHMVFKDVQKMRASRLKRFMARPGFGDELELHRVDCASSNGMLDNWEFLRERREAFASEPLIPPPLVTGRDLIAMGHVPGPAFGRMLDEVQTLQLEGGLGTRDEALAFLEERFPVRNDGG